MKPILLLLLSALGAAAQQPALDFSPVERVVLEEMQQRRTPGAAVAIVMGDRMVYAKGFGVASVETEEPVRPEMLFRLGSTTKMFTAATLVNLAEEGKIDLTQPIGKYVPGLSPAIARLTGHQLLSHTAGLFDEAPMFGSSDDEALGHGIRQWKEERFFTEPGKVYSYSNPGFWLAGFVSESISGKPFADQVASTIFTPVGMSRTTFRPMLALTYPLAQGHELQDNQLKIIRPAANNTATWPAGSMFSNVIDLSRWVAAFVNGGQLDGRQVVRPGLISKLQTGTTAIPGSTNKYGYGLQAGTWRGVRVVEHGGSRAGYGSIIRMAPDHRFGVIILANRTGIALDRTAEKAMEIALPLTAPPAPPDRRPIALSAAEMNQYTGVYGQGPRRMEIIQKDGRLLLKQSNEELPVEKTGESELSQGNSRYVVVKGASGAVEYLHSGGRSWRKLPGR